MTKWFKGRISGNNIRYEFSYGKDDPKEYMASTVEFKIDEEPFKSSFSVFEIVGSYPIGSIVKVGVVVESADGTEELS